MTMDTMVLSSTYKNNFKENGTGFNIVAIFILFMTLVKLENPYAII